MATGGDSTDEIQEPLELVKYGSEQYSLTRVPAETSALVVAQKECLLNKIDLEALVDDLSKAGKFVRVAYNGVAGNTELQITVQGIGFDITKLCNKAAITVAKFTRASHSVVLDLQSTYEFLIEGLEEMAIDTLGAVSKVAETMASAARELGEAFQKEEEKIEATLMKTMGKRGEEEKFKKENESHIAMKAAAMKASADALEAEKRSEAAYREAATEEAETAGAAAALGVLTVMMVPLAPFTIAGAVISGLHAREARREKIKQLERTKQYAEERKKAYAEMNEFTRKIQAYNAREAMGIGGDAAIDALHKAVGALKCLTTTMMRAAEFWEHMEVHCKTISDTKMDQKLEKALEQGHKHQKVIWAMQGFKRRAIEFFAQWVALESVCTLYAKRIKVIQEELYASIRENPTFKQSRANIQEIASNLLIEMEKAHQAIEKQQAESDQQIKELKGMEQGSK